MFKKMLIVAAGSMVALSALAVDASKVEKSIELKDGSTVYLFKDGKMGMENKFGKVVRMKEGHVMETKDGQRVIMIGDEVARLESILKPGGGK
ncbi:periplasmic Cu(I)/Cu(II)-binding protein CopK [Rhodoferax sp.]|uniref:periplasmic Cu(I)/Cu(II)-binding protein CopK n=1 Tax=Rhodoferax sp. TaxID=50421 RepID=UPI00374CED08